MIIVTSYSWKGADLSYSRSLYLHALLVTVAKGQSCRKPMTLLHYAIPPPPQKKKKQKQKQKQKHFVHNFMQDSHQACLTWCCMYYLLLPFDVVWRLPRPFDLLIKVWPGNPFEGRLSVWNSRVCLYMAKQFQIWYTWVATAVPALAAVEHDMSGFPQMQSAWTKNQFPQYCNHIQSSLVMDSPTG